MTTVLSVDREQVRGRQSRRFVDYQIREAEVTDTVSGRYIEGRAVPYNVWTDTGWYYEQVAPGAFAKSIREAAQGLPLLLFHDGRSFPVGVSERWTEESDGLVGLWRMDESDEDAMTALDKAGKRMLTGLSVGFLPVENLQRNDAGELVDVNNTITFDDEGIPYVTRREARLLEVSLTPTPAYVGAEVLATRSLAAGRAAGAAVVEVPVLGRPRAARAAALAKELGL